MESLKNFLTKPKKVLVIFETALLKLVLIPSLQSNKMQFQIIV